MSARGNGGLRPLRSRGVVAAAIVVTTACSATALASPGALNRGGDPPSVSQLSWLAGCWERRRGSLLVQEQWLEPRGGTLVGMSRTTRGDTLVEYEFMRIFARDTTLVFAAQPSGQQPAEFVAYVTGAGRVTFENPSHDFPQRVTYATAVGDSLHASIDGVSRGQSRTVNFRYARATCPQPTR